MINYIFIMPSNVNVTMITTNDATLNYHVASPRLVFYRFTKYFALSLSWISMVIITKHLPIIQFIVIIQYKHGLAPTEVTHFFLPTVQLTTQQVTGSHTSI
jgi:hypothetical protein